MKMGKNRLQQGFIIAFVFHLKLSSAKEDIVNRL